jgi:DNA-binding response OmpR family regulator
LARPVNTTLRVISLRSDQSNDYRFENALKVLGHKVTVLTSTEPAFALVNTTWPDAVIFDPISSFGMSGSVQRMRSSFDGPIVAVGVIPDDTITTMLGHLGIEKFASTAEELVELAKQFTTRDVVDANRDEHIAKISGIQVELSPSSVPVSAGASKAQLSRTEARVQEPLLKTPPGMATTPPAKKSIFDNGLVRVGITTFVAVAVTVAALVLILRNMPESTGEQE